MDERVIANLKSLAIDMINEAGSGHPGIVLSAAQTLYTIYAKHININLNDDKWPLRDRFVLSAGHGGALLYACLYMLDYLSLDDLKKFRKLGSKTPGHPEYGVTKGVEATTGPLGQGIGMAVGMAIASKHRHNTKNVRENYIYTLCGDGDLMEGISYEAASLAGTLVLDNLIILYDANEISLDGPINKTFDEDVCARFEAMGWYTTVVKDGNKISEIDKAITRAKMSGLPSFIEIHTILGDGSLLSGSNKVHGTILTKEDISQLKKKLNIEETPFYVDIEAKNYFKKQVENHTVLEEYSPNENIDIDYFNISTEETIQSTRDSNGIILNELASQTDLLFGGSADVAGPTRVYLKDEGDFSRESAYQGRNIWFGVREHAMGAILNGLALSGYYPFGSTFLTFSDYLKPAIRLSALMDLPVTYIFTHDSINVGADGPTHEPIEQLASLRSIPNFTVYRPADFNEVLGSWKTIFKNKKPSALILSRSETYNLTNSNIENVQNGGYTIYDVDNPDAILIASGTEVSTCINIAKKLKEEGYNIKVVSMPSVNLFRKTSKKYQNTILPVGIKTFFVEAGSSYGLRDFVSNKKYLITLDEFGLSGSTQDVLKHFAFTEEEIAKRIKNLL